MDFDASLAQTAVYVRLALLVISVVIGLAVERISRLVGKEGPNGPGYEKNRPRKKKDFRSYKIA